MRFEDKLGAPLFLRLNKKMLLTQAGELLLSSAPVALDELKRAEDDIRQIALHREGILRISTECYSLYQYFQRGTTCASNAKGFLAPGVTTTRTQPTSGEPGTCRRVRFSNCRPVVRRTSG